jgi:hypothetical protein
MKKRASRLESYQIQRWLLESDENRTTTLEIVGLEEDERIVANSITKHRQQAQRMFDNFGSRFLNQLLIEGAGVESQKALNNGDVYRAAPSSRYSD